MELNGINSNSYTNAASYTSKKTEVSDGATTTELKDEAAVYEKSEVVSDTSYSKKSSKVDAATIEKLKADAEARYAQLQDLVNKLLTKQGETSKIASLSDIFNAVKNGEIEVDEDTIAQAKKDVADDGYWGVEQTAERIVSFAKALTGGDTSKIENMRDAITKGYEAAAKDWGSDLPDISSKTMSRVNELLDEWAKEVTG